MNVGKGHLIYPIIEIMTNKAFTYHSGNRRPVPKGTYVIYRTVTTENGEHSISHVHLPMLAENLVWNDKPAFGRIHDYRVVAKPNLVQPLEHIDHKDLQALVAEFDCEIKAAA